MNLQFLVQQCYDRLPEAYRERPWEVTDHGRRVLQTEDELNAYIAAYGEMHIVKCHAALQNFPFDDFNSYSYEIYDWGCGQGLATLTLLDMLHERNKLYHLKRIYLIEPSIHALNRAVEWVRQTAGPGIEVIPVNKYIPGDANESMPEVTCSSARSINLFSNILDIRNLSLSWLAQKTASLANQNYMICIGPKFTQNSNTRIADFCGYFNPTDYFSNINSYPYSYTSNTHYAFGLETRCFVHNSIENLDTEYQERAEDTQLTDVYDSTTDVLRGMINDRVIEFYDTLRRDCSQSYDIFYRPAINCDTVDFALASESRGIVIVNVCYNLDQFENACLQIEAVKENIFNVHLRTIKIDSVTNHSVYYCVKTALFFPNNTQEEVNTKVAEINQRKNQEIRNNANTTQANDRDFYAYLLKLTPYSNIIQTFRRLTSRGFKHEYYEEFVNLISTRWHTYREGDLNFHLSQRQLEIVRDSNRRLRVKGVAGCGKTQVVANRAVAQHLQTGERVLIITFNISLIQYIKMRISQVPEDFSPNMFEITNYHQFVKSKAAMYKSQRTHLEDYDNAAYFNDCRGEISKYRSIIIDEVQDFKESWLQSIISNFLADDGHVSLFGDSEQNIYEREVELESKMPPARNCGFRGRWNLMNDRLSVRILNHDIASLSSDFANTFMNIESSLQIQNSLQFEEYFIKYWFVDEHSSAAAITGNILWMINRYNVSAEDVVILGQSINLLRDIENEYVQATHLDTMLNFETKSQFEEVSHNTSPTHIQKDLEVIRRAAKTHFTTNCPCIKMSTIHSFKGWESKTIILILQPEMSPNAMYEGYGIQARENTPALIYTAITRAKCNLFILNLGNQHYNSFFQQNIN